MNHKDFVSIIQILPLILNAFMSDSRFWFLKEEKSLTGRTGIDVDAIPICHAFIVFSTYLSF